MSDVTQNRFDKYFDGSELVVAGKVLPSDSNTLTSLTTASAVSKMNKSRLQENLISHESEVEGSGPLELPVSSVPSRPAGPSGHHLRDRRRHRRAGHRAGQAAALVHGFRQTNVGLHHHQTADL